MKNKELIIKDYEEGIELKDILKKYNISQTSFYRIKKEFKAPSNRVKVLGEDLKNIIIQDYVENHLTATDCAKKYNIGRTTVLRLIKNNNIEKNYTTISRPYNRSYFKVIDTEEKAYWFGFIAADGCITRNNSNLEIGLKSSDNGHLKKFLKAIGGEDSMIRYKYCKAGINNKFYETARVTIASKEMCNDLIANGLTSNKSSNLLFPTNIPKQLIQHYLRGYIDGDGWVGVAGKESTGFVYYNVGVIATYEFCNSLSDYLFDTLKISKVKLQPHANSVNNNMYIWRKKGTQQLKIILNYLYKDAIVYLDRKYQSYLDFCRLHPNTTEECR